jgi:hypothetical protein
MNKKAQLRPRKHVKPSAVFPREVSRLAAAHGIEAGTLQQWKVYPDGKVVMIAANGMKFVFEEAPDDSEPE